MKGNFPANERRLGVQAHCTQAAYTAVSFYQCRITLNIGSSFMIKIQSSRDVKERFVSLSCD